MRQLQIDEDNALTRREFEHSKIVTTLRKICLTVSLVFLLSFMLPPTSNSQTILSRRQDFEIPNNTQNNVTAVMVYVTKQ